MRFTTLPRFTKRIARKSTKPRNRFTALTALAVVALAAVVAAAPVQAKAAAAGTGMEKVATSINRFGFDLYRRVGNDNAGKNLFMSPASISTALAMTFAGARGATAAQMARVLHFGMTARALHPAFGRFIGHLNGLSRKPGNRMVVANRLWAARRLSILAAYRGQILRSYGGGVDRLDFARNPDVSRRVINRWVEKKTAGLIKKLLQRDHVTRSTRLVLTNAIYFKGDWFKQFKKSNTRPMDFHRESGRSVKVPMMYRSGYYGHAYGRDYELLTMDYKGKHLSMVVLLPAANQKLSAVEKKLNETWLAAQLKRAHGRKVEVYFPRFKAQSRFSLAGTLRKMGMVLPFSDGADFSGITGGRDLKISAVVHKAVVKVNEEGTEAAAATGVVMAPTGVSRTPVFRADRPFVFMIRDNKTGAILFMGRLHDPTA